MAWRISGTPVPSFALARMTSSRGMASTFSSSSITTSGCADGRSILLRTGMIVRPSRNARWTLASVWASMPSAASTTRMAPSHACRLRLTSYEKSTCPGVSMRFKAYDWPSRAVYSRRTARALIVIPFSRSRSIESRTWLVICRGSMACVSSSSRSARVDFPWSMCAMIEKLRRRSCGMVTRRESRREDRTVSALAPSSCCNRPSGVRTEGGPVDRRLVELAQGGDEDAFDALVRITGDRCLGIAFRILRDVDLAEDAVQNAYVSAWRDLPTLRDPDRFEPWLHRTLARACYEEARQTRR